MEEIIKELENRLGDLEYAEQADMYYLAISKVTEKQRNTLSHPSKSQVRESISNHNEFLKSVNKENDEFYKLCLNEVQENNPERTEIIRTLEAFIIMLKEEDLPPFVEFQQMRKIFKYIGLNTNSQLTLFGTIVKNNASMNRGDDCHVYLPDTEALLNHNYKHITVDEVFQLLKNGRMEEFLADENPANPLGQKEVMECFRVTLIDHTACQKACLKIDEILNKEAEDTTDDDYQILIDNMEYLSFGDLAYRIIRKIEKYKNSINIRVNSNDTETKKDDQALDGITIKDEVSIPLKQKNVNQTLREISKCYDVDSKTLKEMLSMDRIIYVLSLMYSINMEKDSIDAFLRSAMREFKNMHPYAIYNQAYDKFAFLGENDAEIKEHLEMIEYILSDTSIFMCDEEEYIETKRLVEEELREIMRLSNGNFAYEKESAKKLCKE